MGAPCKSGWSESRVRECIWCDPAAHRVSVTRARSSSLVCALPALSGEFLWIYEQHCRPHLQHGLPHQVDRLAEPSNLILLCKRDGGHYARGGGGTDDSRWRIDVWGVPQMRKWQRDSCKSKSAGVSKSAAVSASRGEGLRTDACKRRPAQQASAGRGMLRLTLCCCLSELICHCAGLRSERRQRL